jgi:hypothetical protein
VVSFPQVSPPISCTRLSPPHPSYMPRPSRSSRFYHPHNSGWGVQIMKLLIMKFPPPPATPSLLAPNTPPTTLFSNTLTLRSSLNVSDQENTIYKINMFYPILCKFNVHGSVHLGNVYVQLKVQLDVLFMYSLFLCIFSSTCFGCNSTHPQELQM